MPTAPPSFGVIERSDADDEIALALELLAFQGYCTLDSGLSGDSLGALRVAFDRALAAHLKLHGQAFDLTGLGEDQIVRALPRYAPEFLQIIDNAPLQALVARIFGANVVLNQINGVINPPVGEFYGQSRWHRDLPYQHFTSSRPLAINALFCLDDFTVDNGATVVAVGSHRQERFPAAPVLEKIAHSVTAKAGTYLVLDAMSYHAGGANRTDRPRRAVNQVYTIPLMKQQISFETELAGIAVPQHLHRLFGFGGSEPRSVEEWLQRAAAKAAPKG
jgi:hypothetical protein